MNRDGLLTKLLIIDLSITMIRKEMKITFCDSAPLTKRIGLRSIKATNVASSKVDAYFLPHIIVKRHYAKMRIKEKIYTVSADAFLLAIPSY